MKKKETQKKYGIPLVKNYNLNDYFDFDSQTDFGKFLFSGIGYIKLFELVNISLPLEDNFNEKFDFTGWFQVGENKFDIEFCIKFLDLILKTREVELVITNTLSSVTQNDEAVNDLKEKYNEILEVCKKSFFKFILSHKDDDLSEVNDIFKVFITEIEYNESFGMLLNNSVSESEKVKANILKTLSKHIDLSNTKATEKIIYLKELGVLDYLKNKKPFNTSINALATLLSAITGENITTLQPYLNAMYSSNVDTSKSPYNSHKTVAKVKKQLNELNYQSE